MTPKGPKLPSPAPRVRAGRLRTCLRAGTLIFFIGAGWSGPPTVFPGEPDATKDRPGAGRPRAPLPGLRALAPYEFLARGQPEPAGVAVTRDGRVYFTDEKAGALLEAMGPDAPPRLVVGSLERPRGLISVEPNQLWLVADGLKAAKGDERARRRGLIVRIDLATSALTIVADGLWRPRGLARAGDGTMYVSTEGVRGPGDHDDRDDREFDERKEERDDEEDDARRSSSRGTIFRWTAGAGLQPVIGGFKRPDGLIVRSDGTLLVAAERFRDGRRRLEGSVFTVDPAGTVGVAIGERLEDPSGLALDAGDALFVSAERREAAHDARNGHEGEDGQGEGVILKRLPDGRVVAFATGLDRPRGLALGREGHLVAADAEAGVVIRFRATPAPTLDVTDNAATNKDPFALRGRSTGERILVLGGPQPAGATVVQGAFEAPVALRHNQANALLVFAVTGAGDGLSSPPAAVTIVHDDIRPRITAAADPPPNAAGWNRTDVSVRFACADELSGVAACPSPVSLTKEGARQPVVGTATDRAGNSATATVAVSIDKTPPSLSAAPSPAPNDGGWSNADVTVSFQCRDTLSGVATCSPPQVVAKEGADQTVIGTATDLAGNTAASSGVHVSLDKTAPTITPVPSSPANASGWHNADVTVRFECQDGGSGVASCSPPVAVATEGADQEAAGTVTDKAGNVARASVKINLDKTPPTIAAHAAPPPNANGWHAAPPTVSFECGDRLSGIDACPEPRTVDTEGSAQPVAGLARDRAGNTATASVPVSFDRTPPTIEAVTTPAPNAAGWHHADVTVRFECHDTGSGVAECTGPQVVTAEGPGQTVSGTVTDAAGNTAATSVTVKLDKTPPRLIATRTPEPNAAGWNNGPVTVRFSCEDDGAGVADCPAPRIVSTEGVSTVSGTASDSAGNMATAEAQVSVDRTPPVVAIKTPADGARLRTPTAALTGTVDDPLSGVARVTCNGVLTAVSGSDFACSVTLVRGANRLAVEATDAAGNVGSASVGVTFDANRPPSAVPGGPYSGEAALPVAFDGSASRDPDGQAITLQWDFGDGTTGAGMKPAHTYATAGTFTVRLTVTDSDGASDSVATSASIAPANRKPTANAGGPYAGEVGARIAFDGSLSGDPDHDPLDFAWDFGEGGVSTTASPTHVYGRTGVFTVRLTVSDGRGGRETSVTQASVSPRNQPPAANAGADQTITLPVDQVTLNGSATDDGLPSGGRLALAWTIVSGPGAVTFGSPGAGTTTARFGESGSYVLRLTANDSALAASDDVTVTVNPAPPNKAPVVSAGSSLTITPPGGHLAGSVTDDGFPAGGTLTIRWTKVSGPGTVTFADVAAPGTTATFGARGVYVLRLTADDSQMTAAADVTVTVNTPPAARAGGPYAGETGQPVSFSGTLSSDDDGDPLSYRWTFGDGTSATGVTATHVYASADRFAVTLTVEDGQGGSSTARTDAVVTQANRAPSASAGGPYQGDAQVAVGFSALGSKDPDGDALSYAWDFGDSATGSGPSPAHVYAGAGVFTVSVTVSDGHGGTSVDATTATIGPKADRIPPVVRLSAPKVVLPGTLATVAADANDNVGVESVTFEVNGADPVTVSLPPYQRDIPIPPLAAPGSTVTVAATARDAAHNAGRAEAVLTIGATPDTTAPEVTLRLPPTASPGSSVVLVASATDNTGGSGVASVTFLTAGRTIQVDGSAPYEASFVIPPDTAVGSSLTFVAQALDFAGNHAETSASLAIVGAQAVSPPTVSLSAPAEVAPGAILRLVAEAADASGVSSVSFFVDDVLVATAVDPGADLKYAADVVVAAGRAPGSVLPLRARALNFAGLDATAVAETRVTSARSGRGVVFGEVYDDTTGLPLAGAHIALVGTDAHGGAYALTATSDARGRYSLSAAGGAGVVQVTKPGWTPVDRPLAIQEGTSLEAVDARLTPLPATALHLPAMAGGQVSAGGAELSLPPGALPSDATLGVTSIRPQGLQGLLPGGWSPIAAIDVVPHGIAFTGAATIRVPAPADVPAATPSVLAAWDEGAGAWRALGVATAGEGAALEALVAATGQFAWLLADTVPVAPAPAAAGDLLTGVTVPPVPADALVEITPQPKIILYKPDVRSSVGTVVRAVAPLSSGTRVRARISESYQVTSGQIHLEPFVEDIVLFQRAGGADVAAAYTVTPSMTFEPLDFQQGTITVEVRATAAAASAAPVVGANGGIVTTATGEALQLPASALATDVPVAVEPLAIDALGVPLPAGLSFVGGVTVSLSGETLAQAAVLSVPRPTDVDGANAVLLLRMSEIEGATRFVLVGIGRLAGTRVLSDVLVPGVPTALEGIRSSGRYVFARATLPLGFAAGAVLGVTGGSFDGALIATDRLAVVAFSAAGGAYVIASPMGSVTLSALDLQNQDAGTATGTLASASEVLHADLRLVAQAPRVVDVAPADGARNVPLSAPVVVTFSEGIDPASVGGGLQVAGADGTPVAGALAFSAGNAKVTFRASVPLAGNAAFSVNVTDAVKDRAGRALVAPFTARFTSLSTTGPPLPPAGSISLSVPGADGMTTVTGTQGSASPHDRVSIINVTQNTSFPALVDPNGGFRATFAASLKDKLKVAITDASGNQTVVALPRFSQTNADGSMTTVVGSEGGRVLGPSGIAVDVPEGAFPDGTPVTVGSIDEAHFPIQLTPEQKQFFGFAGGVQLDFGGATPSTYVNVSIPTKGGETADDRWVLVRFAIVGDQQLLDVADTARVIGGRITTSSPPCPGVRVGGTYGFLNAVSKYMGVAYGNLPTDPFAGNGGGVIATMRMYLGTPGGQFQSFALPFAALSAASGLNICIPVLSGRVTVQPNRQRIVVGADQFKPSDSEIVVRNERLGGNYRFPRNVAEFRFLVAGSTTDTFSVNVVSNGAEIPVVFKRLAGPPGFVNVVLDVAGLNASVSAVVVRNLTSQAVKTFPQSTAAVNLAVPGAAADTYTVTIIDSKGDSRAAVFALESPAGTGNLVAKAIPGTIPEGAQVFLERRDGNDPNNVLARIPIPADARGNNGVDDGGFTFAFTGDVVTDVFRVEVVHPDPFRVPDSIWIPSVAITITDPGVSQVRETLNVPVPPPDEPLNLGNLSGDTSAPRLTSVSPLSAFDSGDLFTFTFSEALDTASARAGLKLLDSQRRPVAGEVRLGDKNRAVTFVPDAPLHLGEKYSFQLSRLTDLSGNVMPARDLRFATFLPTSSRPTIPGLGLFRDLALLKKGQSGGATRTLGFAITGDTSGRSELVAFDLTDAKAPIRLTQPPVPVGTADAIVVVPNVDGLVTGDTNPCGGGKTFSGDLAVLATYEVGAASAIRFFDVTRPETPCLLGSKLLTFNPANGPSVGAVPNAAGWPRAVAVLSSGDALKSYTAVENVGLMLVDVGEHIPTLVERVLEPMVPGNYVDVVATNGRLLAVERSKPSLDVFDASLAQLSSTSLPLKEALSVAYAEAVPFDLNKDGQVGQDEILNLAFVGGSGGIVLVDVTDLGAPAVLGSITMDAAIFQVEFDGERRRLFATGRQGGAGGDWATFVVDLSAPYPFLEIDADGDGWDDRIVWRTPPAFFNSVNSSYRALRFDADTRRLYVGTAGGYDLIGFNPPNLKGTVTYTRIDAKPVRFGVGGLDYLHPHAEPVRGAMVELKDAGGLPLGFTVTADDGSYAFDAPIGARVQVVVSSLLGPPSNPTAMVIDNTRSNDVSVYVYRQASAPFVMPRKKTVDIYAETRWDAAAYRYANRDGAPFAILDTVFRAQEAVRTANPSAAFPLLKLAWSVKNRPSAPTQQQISTGRLGSNVPYFVDIGAPRAGVMSDTIYLMGAQNVNTDEYDTQVLLHEWSHYFQWAFSRDDSIGGAHSVRGDVLDPRTAFSEGFATAFGAMVTNDPIYVDTFGSGQQRGFVQNYERDASNANLLSAGNSGFFAERTVAELLVDLFDGTGEEDDADSGAPIKDEVQLGIKPIYDAMVNGVRTSEAFTTIYSFFKALTLSAADRPGVVKLARAESIDLEHADEFGETPPRDLNVIVPGGSKSPVELRIGRLYTDVPVNGTAVTQFGPGTPAEGLPLATSVTNDPRGAGNRLGEHVYFKFDIVNGGPYRITVRTPVPVTAAITVNTQETRPKKNFTCSDQRVVTHGVTRDFVPGHYGLVISLMDDRWSAIAQTFTVAIEPATVPALPGEEVCLPPSGP